MVRVLVTGVGGPAGRSLARQLMDQGHWVLGVDMQQVQASAADVVAVVSPSSSPGYLWELRGLVGSYGIELLVPTVSDELVLVSQARDGFAPGVEVVMADSAPVRMANDKHLTMKCLAKAGVAVPGFGLPGDFGSLDEAMNVLGGSLVVKPRVSHGGRGVQILECNAPGGQPTDLIWSSLDNSWIVQSFAPGTEYSSMVFRSAAGPEEKDLVVVLEKTGLKQGHEAVSVKRLESAEAADVAYLAREAVVALGLTGPIDMDIRRMPDGRPVVLQINARFGANSAHAPELLERVLLRHVPARMLGGVL
ncbi:ATP-grasp domain-containing protein [Paenarthrobacter sp. NPDC092416]|uniref:ATP-grasp domain-containing protein n=1 Tax=Paenarthrobacter sp. NPDC092416 TaxID=3364386 RepID=UPI00381E1836